MQVTKFPCNLLIQIMWSHLRFPPAWISWIDADSFSQATMLL